MTQECINKIVYIVTTKTGEGKNKVDSGKNYYSSFVLPTQTAINLPQTQVLVVDVDHEKNHDFLQGVENAPMHGIVIDAGYNIHTHTQYAEKMVEVNPAEVGVVVPYVSSEAKTSLIDNIEKTFANNKKVKYLNHPKTLKDHASKAMLSVVKKDNDAHLFKDNLLPNVLIETVQEYETFKKQYPDVVLRAPKSTEGVGVYIKGEIEEYGIDSLLKYHGQLLATPYFPTQKSGDMRVYGIYNPVTEKSTVIQTGLLRTAPQPTEENPFPKCNAALGGQVTAVTLTKEQSKVIENASRYYGKKENLCLIGFDLFALNEPHYIDGIGYKNVISEVNFSPDAINLVEGGVMQVVKTISDLYQQTQLDKAPRLVVKSSSRKVNTQQHYMKARV